MDRAKLIRDIRSYYKTRYTRHEKADFVKHLANKSGMSVVTIRNVIDKKILRRIDLYEKLRKTMDNIFFEYYLAKEKEKEKENENEFKENY